MRALEGLEVVRVATLSRVAVGVAAGTEAGRGREGVYGGGPRPTGREVRKE